MDLYHTWPDHRAEERLNEGGVTGNAQNGEDEAELLVQLVTDFSTPKLRCHERGACVESAQLVSVMDKRKSPTTLFWFLIEGENRGHSSMCTIKFNMKTEGGADQPVCPGKRRRLAAEAEHF